jgi:ABC-type tungstate transport system substrate-binding protein
MTEFLKKITKQDIRNTLATAWTALSFIFLFKLLSREIPEGNRDVVTTIAGVIIGQLIAIIGFYFGQSKSEIDKGKPHED